MGDTHLQIIQVSKLFTFPSQEAQQHFVRACIYPALFTE